MQNNNEETIEITAIVKDHIEGEPCEISFYHEGELIGYQTYGRFDPAYPYQGQPNYRVQWEGEGEQEFLAQTSRPRP